MQKKFLSMSSEIIISPVFGESFEVTASASKYAVTQNDSVGTLRETMRFRFPLCKNNVHLGYSVTHEGLVWIIRDAQIFTGAKRIVVDAERETLDYSRCQIVDVHQWESDHDCNSKISPRLIAEGLKASIVEGRKSSISIHDSKRSYSEYEIYMEQEPARKLDGLSLIRGKQDFKVSQISGLDTPGKLAIIKARVHQAKITEGMSYG